MLHGLIQCIFLIYFRIYLSCGVITLVLCINKRRLLWIGECTAFAGYLFVQYFIFYFSSIGGWIGKFQSIDPFIKQGKPNFLVYIFIF